MYLIVYCCFLVHLLVLQWTVDIKGSFDVVPEQMTEGQRSKDSFDVVPEQVTEGQRSTVYY